MDRTNLMRYFPKIDLEEKIAIEAQTASLTDDQMLSFASVYNSKRRDPQLMLIMTAIGFLGVAGIQRIMVDQIAMGIAFMLTGGFCAIGTIIDMINSKQMTVEYNTSLIGDVVQLVKD